MMEIISTDEKQEDRWIPEVGDCFTDNHDDTVMLRVKPSSDLTPNPNTIYAVALTKNGLSYPGEVVHYSTSLIDTVFTPWTGKLKVT
jgi:hypothetical protein